MAPIGDRPPSALRPSPGRPAAPLVGDRQLAAGVLGIFLGMFGVHRFLLGDIRAGLTLLGVSVLGGWLTHGLASVLVAVLVLLEGLLYLTMSGDDFRRFRAATPRRWF